MKCKNLKFEYLLLAVLLFCTNAQAESIAVAAAIMPAVVLPQEPLPTSGMIEKAGRVQLMFSHAKHVNKWWAGTAQDGLWQSSDGGNSWVPASVLMQNMSISSFAADPRHADIFYAGSSDGRSNDISQRGQGMFMSDDGGANWSSLALTNPAIVGANWSHIHSITLNINNVMLTATSDNNRNGFIYRSVDGGKTWGVNPVYTASIVGPHNVIHKVRFDPDNPNAAIFMDDYANVTHSSDAGQTWRVVKTSSTSCK